MDHGAKIHLVQATLGHSDISTTGRYLHARPDESSALYLGSASSRSPLSSSPARTERGHGTILGFPYGKGPNRVSWRLCGPHYHRRRSRIMPCISRKRTASVSASASIKQVV